MVDTAISTINIVESAAVSAAAGTVLGSIFPGVGNIIGGVIGFAYGIAMFYVTDGATYGRVSVRQGIKDMCPW